MEDYQKFYVSKFSNLNTWLNKRYHNSNIKILDYAYFSSNFNPLWAPSPAAQLNGTYILKELKGSLHARMILGVIVSTNIIFPLLRKKEIAVGRCEKYVWPCSIELNWRFPDQRKPQYEKRYSKEPIKIPKIMYLFDFKL